VAESHAIVEPLDEDADGELVAESGNARVRKPRRCLMCSESFISEWSGERICNKCRSRAVWRGGG
jgi:hypothetical protein